MAPVSYTHLDVYKRQRVYSGTLDAGTTVYNSVKDNNERIGRILQMHANNRKDIDLSLIHI